MTSSEILCRYQVVTPSFVGGANHAPDFRLASYANSVRWWWRFLALGRYGKPEAASFWEAVLFGWSARPFGRKRVSFRLAGIDQGHVPPWNGDLQLDKWSGINYLTAQGLSDRTPAKTKAFSAEARVRPTTPRNTSIEAAKTKAFSAEARVGQFDAAEFAMLVGEALRPNDRAFALSQLRDGGDDFQPGQKNWRMAVQTLIDAMALIGLLGGLGARSRRGFGSLAISELKVDGEVRLAGLPESVSDYRERIEAHLHGSAANGDRAAYGDAPPYTAYCGDFSARICAVGNDARDLMNDIGWAFQIYRSWGQQKNRQTRAEGHKHELVRNGGHRTIDAGKAKDTWYKAKFTADHNEFYAPNAQGYGAFPSGKFDNRAVFGLPHNYGKTTVGWDADTGEPAHNRRASPLLFHFHRLADGRHLFVASVAKAKFAPNDARLRVKDELRASKDFGPGNIDWDLVGDFASFVCGDKAKHPNMPFNEDIATAEANRGVIYTSYTPVAVVIT